MALGALLLGAGTIGLRAAAQPESRSIKILARKFTYSPNKLTLKKGVPVVLELTTADVLMGFTCQISTSVPTSFRSRSPGTPRTRQDRYVHVPVRRFAAAGTRP